MVKKRDNLPHDDWSPLLRRVVLDEGQRPSRDAVQRLTKKDVEILRKLARGKKTARGVRRDKVLAVLSERAPDSETAKVLEHVISDIKQPASLRVVAAIGLGRIPAKISEKILFANVVDKNSSVAQRAIQSLGRITGQEGLEKLDAMEPPENHYVLQQWKFSKRLIRHRLGLPCKEPSRIEGTIWDVEGDAKPHPLPMENITPEHLKAIIADLRDDMSGIELAENRGMSFEVDRSLQHLLITQHLTTQAGLKKVQEIPMVAAVIAKWEPRTNKAVLNQIVLTEPLDDGVLVQGFRQDGTLLFEGRGTVLGNKANLTMVNTARASQCRFKITCELTAKSFVASVDTLPRLRTRKTQNVFGVMGS